MAKSAKKKTEVYPYEVDITDDYSIFKKLKGNRAIEESHVRQLMESMKKDDLFEPIIVNEKMEVIDGQHSLEARRRLNLIVPYEVRSGYGLREVRLLNTTQKNWTFDDYMSSYVSSGEEEYVKYKSFKDKYGLSHTACQELLAGSARAVTKEFREGTFKVTNKEADLHAQSIISCAPYHKGYRRTAFVRAVSWLMTREGFDFDRFFTKLKRFPSRLEIQPSKEEYVLNIEELYNYHVPQTEQVGLVYARPKTTKRRK